VKPQNHFWSGKARKKPNINSIPRNTMPNISVIRILTSSHGIQNNKAAPNTILYHVPTTQQHSRNHVIWLAVRVFCKLFKLFMWAIYSDSCCCAYSYLSCRNAPLVGEQAKRLGMYNHGYFPTDMRRTDFCKIPAFLPTTHILLQITCLLLDN
jgi:hypothetical protein